MTNRQEKQPAHVTREILSDGVKDRILTWILEGELAPGSRIVETRVARDLGVSQAPVREALRDLAILGFVE
ncbi:MAG: GntR family transcriptional regulator, partial [Acidimicrobiia bacterium]|nr:GntR family transcriptional regulator [Acidimicrobiia bacterium]